MRRLIAVGSLALVVISCSSALAPAALPSVAFITPAPSLTDDACWLIPDLQALSGRPAPVDRSGSDQGGNLVCSWFYSPYSDTTYDGFTLIVAPSDQFDGVKKDLDDEGAATTITGLGTEAYYWPQVGPAPKRPSYLLARWQGPLILYLEISVGDRLHDREIAVEVAQSAIERLTASGQTPRPPGVTLRRPPETL